MSHHSSKKMFYKGFIFLLVLVAVMFICLVGVLEDGKMNMKTTALDNKLGQRTDDGEIGRLKGKLGLHFISKRRVPNGADPIHNRRAGNSRQPPGRA